MRGVLTDLAALMTHLAKHYSDYQIASDLDDVLACCNSPHDRQVVRRYARQRRNAPGFSTAGNHSNHAEVERQRRAAAGEVATCAGCGTEFAPKRSTARFCSARCRVRHSRDEPVTLTRSESLAV